VQIKVPSIIATWAWKKRADAVPVPVAISGEEPPPVSLADQDLETEPEQPQRPRPRASVFEGCRVAAIGFSKQDIGALASAMIEEQGRVEFLPRGEAGAQGEFDLFLLNCPSIEVLRREAAYFRSILASGTPTIVIGSQASLALLRDSGNPRMWDFVAKPLHIGELMWRAANLLARCESLRALPRRFRANPRNDRDYERARIEQREIVN
jgi:hypothetical protein